MLSDNCVRGALIHASECCALRREDILRLLRNEQAMLRWMCKVKAEDDVWQNFFSVSDERPDLAIQDL